MKAMVIDGHGGPEVFRYAEVPDPVPSAGQILVDVHAASVNAADWKVRLGENGSKAPFPYILGRDFSGVVAALGEGVTDIQIGDAVFGVCETSDEGAYAEKVAIMANIVAKKPDSFSHVEASALALIGLTALVTVEDTLELQAGQSILIQGGAGGVASFAIQVAKQIGAHVITTASASNHAYLRELGADEVIDYNSVDFTTVVNDIDAVFDTIGGEVGLRSFGVLKSGGRAAFIASGHAAPASPREDVRSMRPAVGRDRAHLERIVELVQTGAVRIPPITRYPLADAAAAHRVSEARHLQGKLVFEVR